MRWTTDSDEQLSVLWRTYFPSTFWISLAVPVRTYHYLMCMSDRPESSQEIRCLHVEVTVDWKELLSSQSSKQLTDGGLSTSGEGAGAHTKHMTLDIYVYKKKKRICTVNMKTWLSQICTLWGCYSSGVRADQSRSWTPKMLPNVFSGWMCVNVR